MISLRLLISSDFYWFQLISTDFWERCTRFLSLRTPRHFLHAFNYFSYWLLSWLLQGWNRTWNIWLPTVFCIPMLLIWPLLLIIYSLSFNLSLLFFVYVIITLLILLTVIINIQPLKTVGSHHPLIDTPDTEYKGRCHVISYPSPPPPPLGLPRWPISPAVPPKNFWPR